MAAQHTIRMTEGVIWKHILRFAAPVFLGNLFQQLYSITDSLVVGNLRGTEALAAVTSSGSLIFMMIGLFQGIFIGAGVVTARLFGARDEENVSRAVHTTVAFALAAGVFLTIFGVLMTPAILSWINTPTDVLPNSITYFRIYFSGVIFTVLYNAASGIFQAVGDSRHPLYYLIASSLFNVVLDLLLVPGLGIAGAALATVLSQAISAFLALGKLCRTQGCFRIMPDKIRFHGDLLASILKLGIPSGLQNAIISFANIIVQFSINSLGPMAMAGHGTYSKIEGFAFLPITSFSMAVTTFIGQNLGAGKPERARKGAAFGIISCMLIAELIGVLIHIFIPEMIALFDSTPAVILNGTTHARITTLFYCLLAYSHAVSGVLRGAGRSVIPMVVMMVCWCGIRVSYILLYAVGTQTLAAISWAYPLTWSLSTICFLIYYYRADWLDLKKQQAV